jgi:hypothetical protein
MVLQEWVLQKRHVRGTLAELLLQPEKYLFNVQSISKLVLVGFGKENAN